MVTGVLMTVGGALMYTITSSSPPANVYGFSILLAVGSGLTFQAGYTIARVKASLSGWNEKDIQSVISLQNISQISGTLIPLVISGQIFQTYAYQNLQAVLSGQGFSDTDIRNAVSGAQSELFSKLSPAVASMAIDAIIQAMRKVYILSIAADGVSIVCAVLMKRERLFG